MARPEMLKPFYSSDSASILQLPHVLLKDSLTPSSENDLRFLGVTDRRISFDFLTKMLLPLGQVGLTLGDVWRYRRGVEQDARLLSPINCTRACIKPLGTSVRYTLQTATVRKKRRVLCWQEMPKIRHVIRRSYLVGEDLVADVDLPPDQAPIRSGGAELRRLRALVGIGPRDADRPEVRALEGEHEVSRSNLAHEFVDWVAISVLAALW